MKKRKFKILVLLLTVAMALSLFGCDYRLFPDETTYPLVINDAISYETCSRICSYTTVGFIGYGEEIPLYIRFKYQPNVRINILESEYYEILGPSEFNTNDYQLNSDGYFDVDFSVKITKKTYPNGNTVNFRITCLCGEKDCGRFSRISNDYHSFVDSQNFAFISDSKGVILAKNHSNAVWFNFQILKEESDAREKQE